MNKKRRKPHIRTSTLFTRHPRIYAKWLSQDNTICLYTYRNQSEEVIARYLKMKNVKHTIYVTSIRQINPNQSLNNIQIRNTLNFEIKGVM